MASAAAIANHSHRRNFIYLTQLGMARSSSTPNVSGMANANSGRLRELAGGGENLHCMSGFVGL